MFVHDGIEDAYGGAKRFGAAAEGLLLRESMDILFKRFDAGGSGHFFR
jgi:hypothetical protein